MSEVEEKEGVDEKEYTKSIDNHGSNVYVLLYVNGK